MIRGKCPAFAQSAEGEETFAAELAFACLLGQFICKNRQEIKPAAHSAAKSDSGGVCYYGVEISAYPSKISGEALGGEKGTGFDEPTMDTRSVEA